MSLSLDDEPAQASVVQPPAASSNDDVVMASVVQPPAVPSNDDVVAATVVQPPAVPNNDDVVQAILVEPPRDAEVIEATVVAQPGEPIIDAQLAEPAEKSPREARSQKSRPRRAGDLPRHSTVGAGFLAAFVVLLVCLAVIGCFVGIVFVLKHDRGNPIKNMPMVKKEGEVFFDKRANDKNKKVDFWEKKDDRKTEIFIDKDPPKADKVPGKDFFDKDLKKDDFVKDKDFSRDVRAQDKDRFFKDKDFVKEIAKDRVPEAKVIDFRQVPAQPIELTLAPAITSVDGTLPARKIAVYRFVVQRSQRYNVLVSSEDFAPHVLVRNGALSVSSRTAVGANRSVLFSFAGSPGAYQILVSCSNPDQAGAFRLELAPASIENKSETIDLVAQNTYQTRRTLLLTDSSTIIRPDSAGPHHKYVLITKHAQKLEFQVADADFEPELRLQHGGKLIRQDSGFGLEAILPTHTIRANEFVLTLFVSSANNKLGSYRLRVRDTAAR